MNLIDTVYASEEGAATEEAGVLASLGINGTMFAAQLVNFALVACILWFLILKPLTKKLTERQKMIDDSIENAKRVQENLQKSEQQYQRRIDEAKVDANKLAERAAQEADKLNSSQKIKAKQEIELLVEQAKKMIAGERAQMKDEIRKETAEMIVLALQRVLSEKMTDKKDKELIAEMLKKME